MMLSVLIPTLDEEQRVEHAVRTARASLCAGGIDGEIIVCDGGSTDRTRETAERFGADAIVETEPGRARQWNAGAERASGEVLALLHADAMVDAAWAGEMREAIAQGAPGGWFQVEILAESGAMGCANGLEAMAAGINARTRLFGTATSDQSIFVRREFFETIGGVPSTPVMEGYELANRLRQGGSPAVLGRHVRISGRRWEQGGVVRTMLLGFAVRGAYGAGVDPKWLGQVWHGKSREQ